jgi:hypothetical protein
MLRAGFYGRWMVVDIVKTTDPPTAAGTVVGCCKAMDDGSWTSH